MYTAPSLTHFSDSRESRYFDREIRTAPNEKAEFDDYRKERKKKKRQTCMIVYLFLMTPEIAYIHLYIRKTPVCTLAFLLFPFL